MILLPNTSFWLFFILWVKHSYNNKGVKESFAQGQEKKKKEKARGGTQVNDVTYKVVDNLKSSYSNTIFKLQAPWEREEACLPIYGNIGVRINRAIEIFGPFQK